jgi:RimJ/RimL family protein N-acetyltransferase
MSVPSYDRPALDGALVRLRAREQADVGPLNTLFDDPDVLAGLMLAFPQSTTGFREWMHATRDWNSQAAFVIETLTDRTAIGICAFDTIDSRSRTANFGIWIGKPFWRRGFGTDATRTICRFGFRQMNLQRISLSVYATNPKALRTYERVGFRPEGTRRRAQFIGGRHIDVIEMGLLADELIDE